MNYERVLGKLVEMRDRGKQCRRRRGDRNEFPGSKGFKGGQEGVGIVSYCLDLKSSAIKSH